MWYLDKDKQQATLQLPGLDAQVDLAHPATGVTGVVRDGQRLPGLSCLQVRMAAPDLPVRIQDCYVRQSDLIVRYAEPVERTIRPEIYWRAIVDSRSSARGIELIVSVQTEEWDCDPAVEIAGEFPGARLWHLTCDGAWDEVSLADAGFPGGTELPCFAVWGAMGWYVEMAFPGDFAEIRTTQCGGDVRVQWRLFPQRLEKGVIRRARVRGMFLGAEWEPVQGRQVFDEFLAAPLPLTT